MDWLLEKFTEWLNIIKMPCSNHILIWKQIYKKNQKITLINVFSSLWIMQFLENHGKCEKTYRY